MNKRAQTTSEAPHTVGHPFSRQTSAEGLVLEELESDRTRSPVLSSATFPMVPPPSYMRKPSYALTKPLQ